MFCLTETCFLTTQKSCQLWGRVRNQSTNAVGWHYDITTQRKRSAQLNIHIRISVLVQTKWRRTGFFLHFLPTHLKKSLFLMILIITHSLSHGWSSNLSIFLVIMQRYWIKNNKSLISFEPSLEQKFYRNYFLTFWCIHIFNKYSLTL